MNGCFKWRALSAMCAWLALAAGAADYVEPKLTIANAAINGSSGLAASLEEVGVFFTHNDGNDNRIFAFDLEGRPRGTWRLEGVDPHDVEEMTSFFIRASHKQALVLADMGNNRSPERTPPDLFHLHVVTAPAVESIEAGTRATIIPSNAISTVRFRFEGGREDCEALAFDWVRERFLFINKVPRSAPPSANLTTNVYSLSLNDVLRGEEPLLVKRILTGMPPLPEQITAMDVAPDGSKAVIQTYDDAYEFDFDTDWATTFSKPYSRKIPVKVEPTGHPRDYTFREAICYGRDGKSLYITRELSSWEIENTDRRTPLWKIR